MNALSNLREPCSHTQRARYAAFWLWLASCALLDSACIRDTRDFTAARSAPAAHASGLVTRSWGLCSLIGPRNRNPGIYGTDLGFTARAAHAGELTMLFGDTWIKPIDACQYIPTTSDDFQ